MTKQTYLVGIDGSEYSARAVEQAVNLAEQTGARVKLIYAVSLFVVPPMVAESVSPPIYDHEEEEKRITNNVIKPLIKKFSGSKVTLEHELIWGDATEILCDSVRTEDANLLFVGRRGRSRLMDLIIGSVANKVAHTINIPIMLVP